MGLTPKQREELHQAIYEYLSKNKLSHSAEVFASEANLQGLSQDSSGGTESGLRSMKDILETKWMAVLKLKKQVMELEKVNKQLKDDLENIGKGEGIGIRPGN